MTYPSSASRRSVLGQFEGLQPQLVRGTHWRLEVLPQCALLPNLLLKQADLHPLNEGYCEGVEQCLPVETDTESHSELTTLCDTLLEMVPFRSEVGYNT